MKSIMQNKPQCWVCGSPKVELHHVFYGTGLRELSDKYGCTVYLCPTHHRDRDEGVHFDRELDSLIKRMTQRRFEREYSHEKFVQVFGRNYLE